MGSSTSQLGSPAELHTELERGTKSSRDVMDYILQFMLDQVSIKDFAYLSDQQECKKYVVFMAHQFGKQFYEMKISPDMDKSGYLVFRKMDELQALQGKDSKEKQTMCIALSYFYVRIFQIYGALALSVIDETTNQQIIRAVEQSKNILVPKGFSAVTMGPLKQRGGEIKDSAQLEQLGRFKYFRELLNYDNGKFTFQPIVEKISRSKDAAIAEKLITEFRITKEKDHDIGNILIGYNDDPGQGWSTLTLRADSKEKISGSPDVQITYTNFKLRDTTSITIDYLTSRASDGRLDSQNPILSSSSALIKEDDKLYKVYISAEDRGRPIIDYFQGRIRKLGEYIRLEIAKAKKTTPSGTTFGSTGITSTTVANDLDPDTKGKKIDTHLRLGKLRAHLTMADRPRAHCVARALQLLQTIPGNKFYSYICKKSPIPKPDGSRYRAGLPEAGEKLSTSPGLSALSTLFYDYIDKATPKLITDGDSLAKYITFIEKLASLFEDDTYKTQDAIRTMIEGTKDKSEEEGAISQLHDRRTKGFCQLLGYDDKEIEIDPAQVNAVMTIVKELYTRQQEHTAKCLEIIRELFKLKQDNYGQVRIGLSDNIIKGGFPEIERINRNAREVLVKYYQDCEETYISGIKVVSEPIYKKQVEAKKAEAEAAQKKAEANAAAKKAEAAKKAVTPKTPFLAASAPAVAATTAVAAVAPTVAPTVAPVIAPTVAPVVAPVTTAVAASAPVTTAVAPTVLPKKTPPSFNPKAPFLKAGGTRRYRTHAYDRFTRKHRSHR